MNRALSPGRCIFAALSVVSCAYSAEPLLQIKELTHERKPVLVAYSPDGTLLAVAANEPYAENRVDAGDVILWDTSNWKQRKTLRQDPWCVAAIAFSPDGKWLAISGVKIPASGYVVVYDLATLKEAYSLKYRPDERPLKIFHQLGFTPDGKTLLILTEYEDARLLDVPAFTVRVRKQIKRTATIAISHAGKWLAGFDHENLRALIYDMSTLKEHGRLPKMDGGGCQLAFSPAAAILAISCHDSRFILWDVPGNKEISIAGLTDQPGGVAILSFSPNGKRLACWWRPASDQALRELEGTLFMWDLEAKKLLWRHKWEDPINSLAFSPDGKHLAACVGEKVQIWAIEK